MEVKRTKLITRALKHSFSIFVNSWTATTSTYTPDEFVVRSETSLFCATEPNDCDLCGSDLSPVNQRDIREFVKLNGSINVFKRTSFFWPCAVGT